MKLLCSLALAGVVTLGAGYAMRAADAQMILHCSSVMLHPAKLKVLGQTYTLSATTLMDGTINDEIGINEDPASAHYRSTYLMFTDPVFPDEPVPLYCDMDIADPGDSNWNGVSDFFEVDHAVTAAKSGGEVYFDDGADVYTGTVDMTWDRDAASAVGTCTLRLRIPDFGIDMTFKHAFEVFDYRGTLSYVVAGTNIHCTVNLQRQGQEGSLKGPWELQRIDTDELSFDAASWAKESGAAIQWYSSTDMEYNLYRGGTRTNYFGVLATEDGMPETPATAEYQIYEVHIFDPNDSDGDKIPDLSDDSPPPKPPTLTLLAADKKLKLRIQGEVGRRVYVEQSSLLTFQNATTLPAFTLTNATQEVELNWPTQATSFWRARIE
ncbi:MAG: hypothetical protein QHJ82_11180 [Verrucomicrobiota bacterium]|nr:hypothetical protein [Verrucomicrobiota bacterium]